MSGRRSRVRYSELTSLLDVLFIMLFAALVQAAQMVSSAQDAPAAQARSTPAQAPVTAQVPPVTPPAPAPARAAPSDDLPALRAEAARGLADRSALAGVVRVRISAAGHIRRLKAELAGLTRDATVDLPLLERVPDPDVGLTYLGAQVPALRLCSSVRRVLGLKDLGGALVVIELERPLRRLPVALVEGLTADQLHCYEDEKGLTVLVEGEPEKALSEEKP